MSNWYKLEGHTPVRVDWSMAALQDAETRRVGNDYVGDIHISTVFLGLDHGYGQGAPILFETMIFGGVHDDYQERYCTWDEAEAGHKQAVEMVKQSIQ